MMKEFDEFQLKIPLIKFSMTFEFLQTIIGLF